MISCKSDLFKILMASKLILMDFVGNLTNAWSELLTKGKITVYV